MKKKTICFVIMLIMILSTCFYSVYGINLNELENYDELESSLYVGKSEENNIDTNGKDVGSKLGIGDLDDYKGGNIGSTTKVTDKVGEVLGFIRVIGMIVSVGVLMVLGIKYMVGSVEEKASYKHSMIPYLIGAAILFSGTLLPSMIYDISHNLG